MSNFETNNLQTSICSLCKKDQNAISPLLRCSCKSKGNGKESVKDGHQDAARAPHSTFPGKAPSSPVSPHLSIAPSSHSTWFTPAPSSSKKFDMEMILSLLQKGRITIDDCKQDSVLVITCLDLNLLSKHERNELKKFIQAIQSEAETLLREMGLQLKPYINHIEKDNALRFTLNLSFNPSIYPTFIEIVTHNVPIPFQNAIDKQKQSFNPSPFSTTLKPKNIL